MAVRVITELSDFQNNVLTFIFAKRLKDTSLFFEKSDLYPTGIELCISTSILVIDKNLAAKLDEFEKDKEFKTWLQSASRASIYRYEALLSDNFEGAKVPHVEVCKYSRLMAEKLELVFDEPELLSRD